MFTQITSISNKSTNNLTNYIQSAHTKSCSKITQSVITKFYTQIHRITKCFKSMPNIDCHTLNSKKINELLTVCNILLNTTWHHYANYIFWTNCFCTNCRNYRTILST